MTARVKLPKWLPHLSLGQAIVDTRNPSRQLVFNGWKVTQNPRTRRRRFAAVAKEIGKPAAYALAAKYIISRFAYQVRGRSGGGGSADSKELAELKRKFAAQQRRQAIQQRLESQGGEAGEVGGIEAMAAHFGLSVKDYLDAIS